MKKATKNLANILILLTVIVMAFSVVPVGSVLASSTAESQVGEEKSTAKTYYVAADGLDTNDGLSKDTPISLKGINQIILNGGDTVLLKRGDTFYGAFLCQVANTSKEKRVFIDAYGEGELPTFSFNKRVDMPWTNCGNGFYKIDLSNEANYEGVKNEFLESSWDHKIYVANVNFIEDSNGKFYGNVKKRAEDCLEKYDMYSDDTCVYIKTNVDPYKEMGAVNIAIHPPGTPLMRARKGMYIKNIRFMYCGYGICGGSGKETKSINIENCVFDKIGGANISSNPDNFVRGGNGIEFGNHGSLVVIKNNIFRNIYDVGYTCQGSSPGYWRNFLVTDNVFTYCTQAVEFWCGNDTTAGGLYTIKINNNLCIKNGEGWATHTDGGRRNSTDFLLYSYSAPAFDVSMEHNTFYHSAGYLEVVYYSHVKSIEKFLKLVRSNNNYIYMPNEDSQIFKTDTDDKPTKEYPNVTPNFKEWQEMSGFDKDSTFTAIGNELDKYKQMEQIAYTSNNYHEIVKAAVDAGLTVKAEYDEGLATGGTATGERDKNKVDNQADSTNQQVIKKYIIIAAAVVVTVIVVVIIVIIIATSKNKKGAV
ncbi:MAG: hypothetical protein E7561_03735 [Ruminococcaceae bacterium]|nr:hypothetical protein [Oscillospiraceae bacterium]